MYLTKRSNGFYYLWFKNERGKRQKISTRCTYKADAIKFFQSFKREEYERIHNLRRKLLVEFTEEYLNFVEANLTKGTVRSYRATLKNLLSFVGNIPLTSFTPYHFDSYISNYGKSSPPTPTQDPEKRW